jgi:hypothetical protein
MPNPVRFPLQGLPIKLSQSLLVSRELGAISLRWWLLKNRSFEAEGFRRG